MDLGSLLINRRVKRRRAHQRGPNQEVLVKPHARMLLLVLMLIVSGIAPGGTIPAIRAAGPPPPTAPGASCAPPLDVVPSPNHPGTNGINGLAAVGPDDIWAVGSYAAVGIDRPLIQHWDGTAWTQVPGAVVTVT